MSLYACSELTAFARKIQILVRLPLRIHCATSTVDCLSRRDALSGPAQRPYEVSSMNTPHASLIFEFFSLHR